MAKTASKNNPLSRQKAKEYKFNGEVVSFTKLYSENGKYIKIACNANHDLIVDNNKIVPWNRISKSR